MSELLKRIKESNSGTLVVSKDKKIETMESPKRFRSSEIKTKEIIETMEIFGRLGQAKEFHKRNPFVYDKAGIFWIWDKEERCYKPSDEVDILNNIRRVLNVDTIDSKARNEIIASLKQIGRENIPKEVPKEWIQFKTKIVNIKTDEIFDASPEYFLTSPIPWELGDTEDTPTIDKLFREWMIKPGVQDESWVKTLEEVSAYCLEDNSYMQTIIWECGPGSNGKGCHQNFLLKLLGTKLECSSQLKTLVTKNFETSALYKKKLVIMGEADTYDLTNTNLLKQLSGEDMIRFEFKGKTPFSERSPIKCIISSNSLPVTPDRSNGFYRRNLIIDFPNIFTVGKDVIAEISDEEFRNFCKKCVRIIKELHSRGSFTNGGTLDERRQRYEDRSNPIMHFIQTNCSESPDDWEVYSIFLHKFQEYCKSIRLRPMTSIQTSKALKLEGFDIRARHIIKNKGTSEEEDIHTSCIFGLKLLIKP